MAGTYLFGWDSVNSKWVKLLCDADGKLVIDPTLILENDPTDNEHGKAPDSDWAHDHKADASAHHAKFTASEARDAIYNIFGSTGVANKNISIGCHNLEKVDHLYFVDPTNGSDTPHIYFISSDPGYRLVYYKEGVGYQDFFVQLFLTDHYVKVIHEESLAAAILAHKNIAAAHHAKYTDLEAQTACKLNGTLYWSCSGVHFDATEPDSQGVAKFNAGFIQVNNDGIYLKANVDLPNGAVVTGAEVFGNAEASAETWTLRRIKLSDVTGATLATAKINTEDTSINNATINNSLYGYLFYTTSFDIQDQIWGARISYTL